ncbi:MAG: phosphoribosyl-ATP diphosphatase [Clostridiales Family XIII bacterium]|nr:phosphoribosyl-ATP diphosphatase [Clostridiales Family XIII bacterium]
MNSQAIVDLYEVILDRKTSAEEGSYTAYLFKEGIDKILKKCGEEMSETIIAAKSLEAAQVAHYNETKCADKESGSCATEPLKEDLKNEICDLLYHLLVLMADRGVGIDEVMTILDERAQKTGNLKKFKTVDKNS